MGLALFDGTITTDGSEQDLFSNRVGNGHYTTTVFLNNMQAGDSIILRTYIKDINGDATRLYKPVTVSGSQSADPSGILGYLTVAEYKITIQRIGGSDRAYTWVRAEVT